ncbi:MAG TPA: hypothetical protein VF209_04495 [Patescibacteria group bacterium]
MDIQLPQILFQIVNFGVVLGALTYLLYRPILKVLEERAEKIAEAQKAAEQTLAEKAQMDKKSDEAKQKARQEAAAIIEEARETALKMEAEAMKKAKAKAAATLETAREEWLSEKKQHLADMKKEFVSAVRATAEKVIATELSGKKHEALISQELETLLKNI